MINTNFTTPHNLYVFDTVRTVPDEAKRPIESGNLAGFTDINPMWRIKIITQIFGPCGFGWKYRIVNKWFQEGTSKSDVKAFVDIEFQYKLDPNGEWSDPIPGTGGSSFISDKNGNIVSNDDCFKMALTDALSVAMKSIGVAADVYLEQDKSKYGPLPFANDEGNNVPPAQNYGMPVNTANSSTSNTAMAVDPAVHSQNPFEKSDNGTTNVIPYNNAWFALYRPTVPPTTLAEALNFPLSIGSYKNNPEILANVRIKGDDILRFYMSDNFVPGNDGYRIALKTAVTILATES